MRIDRNRLAESMDALGRIGATARGGLHRVALTDDDRRGRDVLVGWMREAGLQVSVDQMGNIFGLRAGTEARPPVFMGSHADSVPSGGRYDGQLGVLCALEILRTLDQHRVRTPHPVGMIVFTNEEGARFQPAMIASGVMAGKIALEDAYNTRDRDGIRLVDELERIGYLGAEPCVPRPMRAYLELHIEQGPILEEEGLPLGVVEGIVAIAWSRVTLTGTQDHAGPTPMRVRHDALVAAAEIVAGVRGIARRIGGDLVSTVGSTCPPTSPTRFRGASSCRWTSATRKRCISTARSRCWTRWCGWPPATRACRPGSTTTGACRGLPSTRRWWASWRPPRSSWAAATGASCPAPDTTRSTWRPSAPPG
jgi:N-carbamoyl-L-amino-acid hydrolase